MYEAQKVTYSKAPLPKSVIDSLDDQIDAAIARLTAEGNRFQAILDDLVSSIQDRQQTLDNLKSRA